MEVTRAYGKCEGQHTHEAGMRRIRNNRLTGQHVMVYDGTAQGMDTFSGRWQTVCEAHSNIISHETLATAIKFASHPAEWCDQCADTQQPDPRHHALPISVSAPAPL